MKILILSEAYPTEHFRHMSFVHTRSIKYLSADIETTVLSFSCKNEYTIDGVKVIGATSRLDISSFDLILSHAPNLKNHLIWICLNLDKIKNPILFFIHGHEVLRIKNYYPSTIENQNNISIIKDWLTALGKDFYDDLKLHILKLFFYYLKIKNKCYFVFVSKWMLEHTCLNLNLKESFFYDISTIIPNAAHSNFQKSCYNVKAEKVANFITLRPHFDNPKYAIDIVYKFALENPQYTFHVFGSGVFFNNKYIPTNLSVFNKFFNQSEIPLLLDQYSAALMPTRLDSQGVMVSEMATYGIPIVTSDIEVAKDCLNGYQNAYFISNEDPILPVLAQGNQGMKAQFIKYCDAETTDAEIRLFRRIISHSKKGDLN